MEFQVAPGVLIPRPETEHLVEAAAARAKSLTEPAILDIGTGSGVIAISLRKELPHAVIFASDISGDALNIARRNAERLFPDGHRITFAQGNLLASSPTLAVAQSYSFTPPRTYGLQLEFRFR